jgi:RecA/RadA recombinase
VPVTPESRQEFREWVVARGSGTKIYDGEDGLVRIPFKSPLMTWATTGGMPIGHIGRWYGVEGSGKSLTNWGLAYCAQNYPAIMSEYYEREIHFWEARKQRLKAVVTRRKLKNVLKRFPDGMSVLLFDTEQRAEPEFGARLGVNMHPDHCLILEENIIEEIIEEMIGAIDAYHVMIIDSATNAQSYAEANLDPGEYERGTAAAAWKRLRKVRKAMDRQENTIIIVDQMRTHGLGGTQSKFSGPEVAPPNVRFLRHNASIAIAYSGGKKLYLNNDGLLIDDRKKASHDFMALGSDGPEIAGIEMRCKIDKNSTGKPFRNSVARFRFDVADARSGELVQEMGFDEGFELLVVGEHFHIIESAGGGMFYALDDKFKRTNQKWKGEWRAIDGIMEDGDLSERILSRLRMAT